MSKGFVAVLAAVFLGLLAVGCGGSSDSDALTKSEFVKQADKICTQGEKSIEDGAEKFAKENNVDTEKPTKAQKEEVITQVVAPAIRKQGEEIGDLGAPSGEEDKVEALVTAVEEGADELEQEPTKLFEGKNPLAQSEKLAAEYGLKVCGGE